MYMLSFLVYWAAGIVIVMVAYTYGLSFRAAYCATSIVTIMVGYTIVRDKTALRPPPPVPSVINPYEIAYLRGGRNGVIRTVLYALYQLGFVEVTHERLWKGRQLLERANSRDPRELTELEQRVLRSIHQPVEVRYLFQRVPMGNDIEQLCAQFRNNLESDELLRPRNIRRAAFWIALLASGILLYLPSVIGEIDSEVLRDQGLVVLMFLSLVLLWIVVGSKAWVRVSDRGRAYLERLRVAFADMRQPAALRTDEAPRPETASVLLVGLFGLGILSGSSDAAFAALFARGASGSSGGCGGGCGAGCGGGCGGGGCGGGNGG